MSKHTPGDDLQKLFDTYERWRDWEVAAMRRHMQYMGYETGRKGAVRAEECGFKAAEVADKIRETISSAATYASGMETAAAMCDHFGHYDAAISIRAAISKAMGEK